jgi:hypothetical protein
MRLLLSAIVVLGLTASAAIPQEKEPKTPKLMDNPTDKEAENHLI